MQRKRYAALAVLLALVGCASAPTAPSVLALPGSGRNFSDFRLDDEICRRYAFEQNGGVSVEQRANASAAGSAAVGTAVGAAAGAAFGGRDGATVGAGTGLIMGSVIGIDSAQRSAYGTQRQYDNAYIQCMYAKGHRVPAPPGMMASPATGTPPPPPPPAGTPPPPPPHR